MNTTIHPESFARIGITKKNKSFDCIVASEELNITLGNLYIIKDLQILYKRDDFIFATTLLLLWDSINKGSLCLSLQDELLSKRCAIVGVSVKEVLDCINKMPDSICANDFKTLAPLVCVDNFLYFHLYAKNANELQVALEDKINNSSLLNLDAKTISKEVKKVLDASDYTLDPLQILAIVNSLHGTLSIISGGPGTGKTTVMCSVLKVLISVLGLESEYIKLAAPTGRAAKRMGETVTDIEGLEPQTLHRLLGANPTREGYLYNKQNKIPAKVIVLDEVSMVDISLMNAFIQAVPMDCILILLGDQYQLPSVGVGAVLADLMPPINTKASYSAKYAKVIENSLPVLDDDVKNEIMQSLHVVANPSLMSNCVTILETSQRCEAHISKFSSYIKVGDCNGALSCVEKRSFDIDSHLSSSWDSNSGLTYFKIDNNQNLLKWRDFYLGWVDKYMLSDDVGSYKQVIAAIDLDDDLQNNINELDDIFASINQNRLLCSVRRGAYGCDNINEKVSLRLKQSLGDDSFGTKFHGSIIMVTQNNKAMGLFNGDTGVILRCSTDGQLRAVFPNSGSYTSFSLATLPNYQMAFAITVHKSQGSEFERIMLVLPNDIDNKLLTREIIYTGLTRAKQSAHLVANPECLKVAIEHTHRRYSGLRFWESD